MQQYRQYNDIKLVLPGISILNITPPCHLTQSINIYIIIRVHSGFSLVENCDQLEDRRTLTPFQRQANQSSCSIIDSQWRALLCIDHDHVKWHA